MSTDTKWQLDCSQIKAAISECIFATIIVFLMTRFRSYRIGNAYTTMQRLLPALQVLQEGLRCNFMVMSCLSIITGLLD
jgi:hypothetical protein